MNPDDADAALRAIERADHAGRVVRLLELDALLPSEGLIGMSGQAGHWLFEDVKATWLYGCFTATVLTSVAFCRLQLSGLFRQLPDDPGLPAEPLSLEDLARLAADRGYISRDLQTQLVLLDDAARPYTEIDLHRERLNLERRMVDAEVVGNEEHPLLEDARAALKASVAVLFR